MPSEREKISVSLSRHLGCVIGTGFRLRKSVLFFFGLCRPLFSECPLNNKMTYLDLVCFFCWVLLLCLACFTLDNSLT